MPLSEAKKRANNKYNLEHYTVVGCKLRKEKAEEFKKMCQDNGTTPNAVLTKAIDDFMEHHI